MSELDENLTKLMTYSEKSQRLGELGESIVAQQLQAAMRAWLQAPDLRQQAGRWLRRRIEREFDWSRVCEDFERLYDRLLSTPQVRH